MRDFPAERTGSRSVGEDAPHDVIGIGFGPSNLALAIALEDAVRQRGARFAFQFIEKQESFAWHGGMLLPGSNMQISFLKDLVSLRDPTSAFTFVNYLREKGRLEAFINLKSFFPSRIEYNDYLNWAASRFEDHCAYGEEVVAIEPEAAQGCVTSVLVRSRRQSGEEVARRARNLVIAAGGAPNIPAVFEKIAADSRVFHSSSYLDQIGKLDLDASASRCIAVIGGGQSAAEIIVDLHARFPALEIDLIFRSDALKPSDDTPFVNEIFDPGFTDLIFRQPIERREAMISGFRNTNYGVVDGELIDRIYAILYGQRVAGRARLTLFPGSEVVLADLASNGIKLQTASSFTGAPILKRYDAVVLATGYIRTVEPRFRTALDPYIDGFSVDRNYRLQTKAEFLPRIVLQGYCEASHGLSDTLLSVLAIRSREIANAILDDPFDCANRQIAVHEAISASRRHPLEA